MLLQHDGACSFNARMVTDYMKCNAFIERGETIQWNLSVLVLID